MRYNPLAFFRISSLERRLFFEAFFWLLIASVVRWLPLSSYKKWLGKPDSETPVESLTNDGLVRMIQRAIHRAVKYTPWPTLCLVQAMTAKKMLRSHQLLSTIYLGIRKQDNKLKAHAWVRCGTIIVTGKKGMELYTVVGRFAS